MVKHIVVIASVHKGSEFIEEVAAAGWRVTLVTRKKVADSAWPWDAISDLRTVSDDAGVMEFVRAVTNVAGSTAIDRIVGLDEFDVLNAALAREHLDLPGMSRSFALRFRDKFTMRKLAREKGIPCPDFVGTFNIEEINNYLASVPGPWIIKPRHEVSAFGIRKCETPDEVWDVLTDLDNRHNWRDHPSQFLIERFIEGSVYHVDSVVSNGKIVAAGVSRYGTTPYKVTHHGGVFTSSIVPYRTKTRRTLEKMNAELLAAFEHRSGVAHAEFLESDEDGKLYMLEVACRVGGAYIADVLEHACGFNIWREWAKLEIETPENRYKAPKLRKDFAGIALALANVEQPDTSAYVDEEIVYRVNRPKHVGLIVRSAKQKRVEELLAVYSERIGYDFLAIAPAKQWHDEPDEPETASA